MAYIDRAFVIICICAFHVYIAPVDHALLFISNICLRVVQSVVVWFRVHTVILLVRFLKYFTQLLPGIGPLSFFLRLHLFLLMSRATYTVIREEVLPYDFLPGLVGLGDSSVMMPIFLLAFKLLALPSLPGLMISSEALLSRTVFVEIGSCFAGDSVSKVVPPSPLDFLSLASTGPN